MKLSELESNSSLTGLAPAACDIASMYQTAARFLKDAGNEQNSNETRLDLAYHSIFAVANMALRACGFKLKGVADSHLLTLDTLMQSIQIDRKRIQYYQALRSKRHRDFYTGRLVVSASERDSNKASRTAFDREKRMAR